MRRLALWTFPVVILGLASLTLSLLFAAPLPKPKPSKGPPVLVADNLRLELTPVKSPSPVLDLSYLRVRTTLHNLSDRQRADLPIFSVLDPCKYHANVDSARLCVELIVWFPDGRAAYLWLEGSGSKFERQTVAPRASASAILRGYKLGGFLDADAGVMKRNRNCFCVIAVDVERRLQSNTLSYNGCPLPPSSFNPFHYCRETPEGIAHYKAEEERARKAAEPAVDLTTRECITAPVERVIPPLP